MIDDNISLEELEKGVLIDGDIYFFIPTTDPKEASEYNGFIDLDGNFYKVNKRLEHDPSHNRWAYYYKKYILSKENSVLDNLKEFTHPGDVNYLMNAKKFIYYGHNITPGRQGEPILLFPKKNNIISKLSDKQANMLFNVMQINKELEYYPRIEDMEEIALRDSYFDKRIREYNEGGTNK